VNLGATVPYDSTAQDPSALRDFVQGLEEFGFDYLAMADHILTVNMSLRDSGSSATRMQGYREPLVNLAYIAACTSTIGLATSVLVLTQRQTALVAKQAAEVDLLSGGRLRLGIGVGWSRVEFGQLGQDFHTRGRRIEEQIAVLRALWTQESVNFHGRWHHITEAGINPLPVQRPIPLWMGGNAEPVLRRAARLADGWLPEGRPDGGLDEQIARVRHYAVDAGRSPADLGIHGRLALRSSGPGDWTRQVASWQALGVTGLSVTTSNAGCATVGEHLNLLRRFKEAVGQAGLLPHGGGSPHGAGSQQP